MSFDILVCYLDQYDRVSNCIQSQWHSSNWKLLACQSGAKRQSGYYFSRTRDCGSNKIKLSQVRVQLHAVLAYTTQLSWILLPKIKATLQELISPPCSIYQWIHWNVRGSQMVNHFYINTQIKAMYLSHLYCHYIDGYDYGTQQFTLWILLVDWYFYGIMWFGGLIFIDWHCRPMIIKLSSPVICLQNTGFFVSAPLAVRFRKGIVLASSVLVKFT